jgi:hypothetical protein
MKPFSIKLEYDGKLKIERDNGRINGRGDCYNTRLAFSGSSITPATRARFTAFVSQLEWQREEVEHWSWDLDGDYCDEYFVFVPVASGSDADAKRHLLYELLPQDDKDAEYERQLAELDNQ